MMEQMMSSGVYVVQVWVELLPGGQVEVRAGLSDGGFLLLDRTDGDLAQMMKRLVDGFLDDREMLSSSLLTGLLRVRAADQISDVRVKTVELNKLLQSIISLPHKFSQSEVVLDFFRPSAKDRIFRPAQDPTFHHETSPIIKSDNKDKVQTEGHGHQGEDQTVRDKDQEQDQTLRHQSQEKDQTLSHQGQEKDQTIRHQGQEKDQTLRHQGQEKDQTIRHQGQEKDQTLSHQGQEKDQTIRHQGQEKDQTLRHQGQEKDQTLSHQGQEKDQTLRHQGQEKDQTLRHQGQEKDQTLSHQGQEKDQTLSHQGQEKDQTLRHQGQEKDQTLSHQGQEKDQTIRHQGQEKDRTISHQGQEKDQTIRDDAQEVVKNSGQQDQEDCQTIRNQVLEEEQIFRQKDHEENKTNRNQVQGVDHIIRHEVQEEDQTVSPEEEAIQTTAYQLPEVDLPIRPKDQEVDLMGQEDQGVLRRASVLPEVWRSNGFCLANTETILFDLTPPTPPVSQSDESTDRRDDGQTEEAELQTCPAPWLGPLHLLHSWTQETDILE